MCVSDIFIKRLTGDDILLYLPEVARLRIEVFREYPYLYEGDLDYEKNYLHTYASSAGSIIIAAIEADSGKVVGVSTGLPMTDADKAVQEAFVAKGHKLREWFYHGESVLLPAYRGRGIGVQFFQEREAQAIGLNCRYAAFCGVVRPADHPQRPPDYVPLNDFWQKRGYRPMEGVQCFFHWKELGETAEKEFPMAFWYKDLRP